VNQVKYFKTIIILIISGLLVLTACAKKSNKNAKEIRIGYFANITHSQALVGLANGTFQKNLGKDIEIKKEVFKAGPDEIGALFSGALDIGYIGPSPAVNGYIRSQGQALKIIAGASSGGAVLAVKKNRNIYSIKDLGDKKVATPQLGNTQDVALRHNLQINGLKATDKNGTVEVIPTENATILTLFQKNELDAAWVPEPWGAILKKEAGAKILINEEDLWPQGKFSTACVIVNNDFLKDNPDLVKKFLKAHIETTDWINANPLQAQTIANMELKKLTTKNLTKSVLKDAFSRLTITNDPVKSSIITSAGWAYELGFIKEKPNLNGIFDLTVLNEILKEKKKETIQ
jgi:NitT/TauT family transport system substrate-binding protein